MRAGGEGEPGPLHESIRDLFESAEALGFDGVPGVHTDTVDKGHGRVKRRERWDVTDRDLLDCPDLQAQWPQPKTALTVVGHRHTAEGDAIQPRYYIGSLAGSAELLPAVVRSHWSIANSLHWIMDVTFREDQCQVRTDNGPQNINTLRQIGRNLLKNEKTLKAGIKGKRLNSAWNEDYVLKAPLG